MHDLCHVFFHLYSVRVLIVCYPEAFNTVSYYIQLNVQPEKKNQIILSLITSAVSEQ